MNFTIKQSNQNPIFENQKVLVTPYLMRTKLKSNFIAKKVIREIKRDKNTQKVFLNPKEKKFK
ncbi:hypothetical protein HpCOL116_08820 [Helicobacter pylori]